jgi:transposase
MSVTHPTVLLHGGLPAPAGPTGGIDWARDDHAVSVVDPDGRQVARFTVAHTTVGLRQLVRRLGRASVSQVAIERPDGPVIDALLAAGLTVVVIPPSQLKQLRSRYGSAGNKDDRFDAFVLADVLRTDRHRLLPLAPTPRPPSPCGRPAAPARTWSATGSRSPTSSAPTCSWPSPPRSACSPTSIAPSAGAF